VSFKETDRFLLRKKAIKETGNPIRTNLVRIDRNRALERFSLSRDKFTILVMGGSQGAHFINQIILETLEGMDEARKVRLQVIHLCGRLDLEFVNFRYKTINVQNRVFSFLDMMSDAYSACDLAISRAGATSIAELAFFGRPAVLVPYPNPKVHQAENAGFMETKGAAVVVEQSHLSKDRLKGIILDFMDDKDKLNEMSKRSLALSRPDAAHRLAMEILDVVKR
jgi:UDP-N-acetylglucosamine--N-acetylmuramyl-(pentapeptide) pyrophosphoryl-undecaprenol N-acetylglucosamine transferase